MWTESSEMTGNKWSLQLNLEQDKALRQLYRFYKVTTDNLPRVPRILGDLAGQFDALTDRNDSPEDLLHYMVTRRKDGLWEKLGRVPQPEEAYSVVKLDAEHWPHLDAIYEELQIGSDNFAFDEDLAAKFSREFARRTGRVVPALVLAAAVIARRKNSGLKTLKPKKDENDLGFRDIDEVA
jgi:hypothetical protein